MISPCVQAAHCTTHPGAGLEFVPAASPTEQPPAVARRRGARPAPCGAAWSGPRSRSRAATRDLQPARCGRAARSRGSTARASAARGSLGVPGQRGLPGTLFRDRPLTGLVEGLQPEALGHQQHPFRREPFRCGAAASVDGGAAQPGVEQRVVSVRRARDRSFAAFSIVRRSPSRAAPSLAGRRRRRNPRVGRRRCGEFGRVRMRRTIRLHRVNK